MKRRLVICGTQGSALVVADAVVAMGTYELLGFIGKLASESGDGPGEADDGCQPVLGDEDHLQTLAVEGEIDAVFVAIGENQRRTTLAGTPNATT